ncbi:deoxynucleoside kinase, partial [Klebsiella pneumoniae]|nr:deoxynucleoside kinase [Klebsiella pneumoniae]
IAIVGNIGAGKTTLATKLAQHFKWEVFLEAVDDNPYLKDFYEDMPRWAFHLQVFFLNSRFNQVLQINERTNGVVQDRTIYE